MVRTEATKEAQKRYYAKNKEKINEINKKSSKKRYAENEEMRIKKKQYYENNKERILEQRRLDREKRKEEKAKAKQDKMNSMEERIALFTEGMNEEKLDMFRNILKDTNKNFMEVVETMEETPNI